MFTDRPSTAATIGRSARLVGLALRELVVLLGWLGALCVLWFPAAVRLQVAMRADADAQRTSAAQISGTVVASPGPLAVPANLTWWTAARTLRLWLAQPGIRRDVWWHLANPVVGLLIAVIPFAVPTELVWGLLQPIFYPIWHETIDSAWVFGVPVWSHGLAFAGAGWALVVTPLLLCRRTWYLLWYARWVRAALHVDRTELLQARVRQLTRTRVRFSICRPTS